MFQLNDLKKAALVGLMAALVFPVGAVERDLFKDAPWTLGLNLGYNAFEGDQMVEGGVYPGLTLGYSYSPRWTFELEADLFPSLKNRTFSDGRPQLDDNIVAGRLGLNALFHLRNVSNLRVDPFVMAGVEMTMWEKSVGNSVEPGAFLGVGLFYHMTDAWALRGDLRGGATGEDVNLNFIAQIGVNYRFGTGVRPDYRVSGGNIDTDGDGLFDQEEAVIGTDPFNPDTDGDGLTDGEEVKTYKTNPLNPDTDYDGLKDGAEVHTYKTDPLNADTDNGGVRDGHEVIEDSTNPLDPADDLILYTLNIEFDYDKDVIKPQYFDKLDIIVKVLQRDPEATARIEGHADKRPKSDRKYNLDLSERRAKAARRYVQEVGGIAVERMTVHGYGFDRPIAPNDNEENMAKNRRVEVYIRKGDHPSRKMTGTVLTEPVTAP